MADINVKQLSKAIKIDLDNLLAQMKAAGLSHKSEKDIVLSLIHISSPRDDT